MILASIDSMLEQMCPFVSGKISARLNDYQPSINLHSLIKHGKKLYCHLPLGNHAHDISKLLLALLHVAAKNRQTDLTQHAWHIIADDWHNFFNDEFAIYKAANMPVSLILQSLEQIDKLSPTFSSELLDNIATVIILKVNSTRDLQYAAKILGIQNTAITSALENSSQYSIGANQQSIDLETLQKLQVGTGYISTINNGKPEMFYTKFINPVAQEAEVAWYSTTHIANHLDGLNIAQYISNYTDTEQIPNTEHKQAISNEVIT